MHIWTKMFLCFLRNTAFRHSKRGCGSLFCDAEGVVFSFAFIRVCARESPTVFLSALFRQKKRFLSINSRARAWEKEGVPKCENQGSLQFCWQFCSAHNSARLVRRAIRTAMRSTSKHRSFPFIRRGLTVSFSNFNRELSTTLISLSTRTTRTTMSASTVFIR